jgi:hypothetical protein
MKNNNNVKNVVVVSSVVEKNGLINSKEFEILSCTIGIFKIVIKL